MYYASMTHYRIAKSLGVSQQAVSQWYTGKTFPSAKNLLALSRLLNKSPEVLLTEFSKKQKSK